MGGGAEEERGMDMASGEEGKQLVRTAIALLLNIPKLFAFGYFEIELIHKISAKRVPSKERGSKCPSSTSRWWVGMDHRCCEFPLQHGSCFSFFSSPIYTYPGPGWHRLFLRDLCQTFGGALWRSRERQNLTGEIFLRHLKKTFDLSIQVGSILAGFIMLVGPISSALVNKFGPRLTCIGK